MTTEGRSISKRHCITDAEGLDYDEDDISTLPAKAHEPSLSLPRDTQYVSSTQLATHFIHRIIPDLVPQVHKQLFRPPLLYSLQRAQLYNQQCPQSHKRDMLQLLGMERIDMSSRESL